MHVMWPYKVAHHILSSLLIELKTCQAVTGVYRLTHYIMTINQGLSSPTLLTDTAS